MPDAVTTSTACSIDAVRAHFPGLSGETILFENAGGSQVPAGVADAMRDYMLTTYVQLGGQYGLSQTCGEVVRSAHEFINTLFNGDGIGETLLGASCTELVNRIAACYGETISPGDEVIITELGHEANVGAWERLRRRGATIHNWTVDPNNFTVSLDELDQLLSKRTRLVAIPQVSNLFGEIIDVRAITELCHHYGARVALDSVAYAPHRAMDVKAWGVDWCVYSTYKVYGPHMGAMFGTYDAFAELEGPNHFFVPNDELPRKFEPGGASHEGCAGLLALRPYLQFLAHGESSHNGACDRATIERAFAAMTAFELPLQARLIDFLIARDDVRIIGPTHAGASRVATISFVHASKASRDIAAAVCARNIAIKHGHMYSYRLCERLGLDVEDGV
ncbi:MAG: aminotransferase class V-fold PLP-dependent enzyme, partial [Phycisphaerales bacterium]|nr:aminotransferase class V-fold PLP-dependent enzyme [Phycisphaerales bacterium]